jgi:hypothetical protein
VWGSSVDDRNSYGSPAPAGFPVFLPSAHAIAVNVINIAAPCVRPKEILHANTTHPWGTPAPRPPSFEVDQPASATDGDGASEAPQALKSGEQKAHLKSILSESVQARADI